MPHVYYLPCYDFVNNIWWTVTDMKLTKEYSAPLYSYLTLTSNILLTPPALTNPQSVFFSWCKTPNFTPTQNDSNNVSSTAQYMQQSELNSNKYCLNLSCSLSQDHGPSQFCHNLTYLKPDVQQSDSSTSQALWHTIQTDQHFTIRTAHNPLSTVQMLH